MTLQRDPNDAPQHIQYVYGEISQAGTAFVSESQTYQTSTGVFGSTQRGAIQIPRGGDALVDHAMATVLGLTYDVHQLVGDAMYQHGTKLVSAQYNMKAAEDKTVDMIFQQFQGSGSLAVDPYPAPDDGTNPDLLVDLTSRLKVLAYRVMPRNFAAPRIESAPALAPFERDLVGGDPSGLSRLAEALTGYVQGQGNATVHFLKNTVESLVKDDDGPGGYHASDGGWIGPSAYAFRNAFIVDAAVMNGLHCTMCKSAGIISDFAAALARAESGAEAALRAQQGVVDSYARNASGGTGATYSGYLQHFSAARDDGQQILVADIPGLPDNELGHLRNVVEPYFNQAETARHTAASRLTGMGEILLNAIHYYDKHASDTGQGPGDFVTRTAYATATGAHADSGPDLKTLSGDLTTYESQLKMHHSDTDEILRDLSSLGVPATILNDVKNYKSADGTLSKAGGIGTIFNNLLPIIAEIGIGAAVA